MCVYSAYVREVGDQMPWINPQKPFFPSPATPYVNPFAPPAVDPKILQEILEIGKRLDRIDKALGLKDCKEEDVAKRQFEANLEALIKKAKELQQYGSGTELQKAISNDSFKSTAGTIVANPAIGGVIGGAQWGIASTQAGYSAGQSLGNGSAGATKGLQSA